ncbi:MAG: class I SAM-dependent methyltransferase [Calditrichia bacterium]|nr:class I SAM-dependent methyltransferase [Calditrichia bacterium]
MTLVDKKHWYDGWFYAAFVDTKNSLMRKKIIKSVNEGQTILDVGCGTGGLSISLAENSVYVLGVDISASQIQQAKKRKKMMRIENVEFLHADAGNLSSVIDRTFDAAILVFMIHEINHSARIQILKEVKKYSKKVYILDYTPDMPLNFWGTIIRLIEFFAGSEHYNNFRDYRSRGGMVPLLNETGFKITSNKLNRMRVFRVITALT